MQCAVPQQRNWQLLGYSGLIDCANDIHGDLIQGYSYPLVIVAGLTFYAPVGWGLGIGAALTYLNAVDLCGELQPCSVPKRKWICLPQCGYSPAL